RRELAGLVLRIGIGIAHRLGDRDNGFLITGVVVEDLISLSDLPQMLLRKWVLHSRPRSLSVFYEIVPAVVGRFFLEEPVHEEFSIVSCRFPSIEQADDTFHFP